MTKILQDSCTIWLVAWWTARVLLPRCPIHHLYSSVEKLNLGTLTNTPNDSAGIQIQQRKLVAILSTPKINQDYIDYVHTTMKNWGITQFTMDLDKHYDNRFNQIMSSFSPSMEMGYFFWSIWSPRSKKSCTFRYEQTRTDGISIGNTPKFCDNTIYGERKAKRLWLQTRSKIVKGNVSSEWAGSQFTHFLHQVS